MAVICILFGMLRRSCWDIAGWLLMICVAQVWLSSAEAVVWFRGNPLMLRPGAGWLVVVGRITVSSFGGRGVSTVARQLYVVRA